MADYTLIQSGDPDAAENVGGLAGDIDRGGIVSGLALSNYDSGAPSIDVAAGKTVHILDTATAEWTDNDGDQFAEQRDKVQVVVGLDAQTVGLDAGAVNELYVDPNWDTTDSPKVKASTTGAPNSESEKIGEVDTSNDTVSERWGVIEEDGTLSFPDADAANAALSSLPSGVAVIDRTNGVRMVDGKFSVATLEADSYTDAQDNTITDFNALGGKVKYLQDTEPSNPSADETWYDTSVGVLRVYDGSRWRVDTVFRVQEEAVTFDETDLTITTTTNTTAGGGDVTLAPQILIDDFEDGDITAESTEWNGWDGDTSNFSAVQKSFASGDYVGEISSTDDSIRVHVDKGENTTKDLIADVYIETTVGSEFDFTDLEVQTAGGGSSLGTLRWLGDGSAIIWNAQSEDQQVKSSWSTNTNYNVRLSFDFNINEVEIIINGVSEGTYSIDSASGYGYVEFYNKTTASNQSWSAYIDNVKEGEVVTNGKATVDFVESDFKTYDAVTYRAEEPSSGVDTSSVTCDVIDENNNVLKSDIPPNVDTDISDIDTSKNPRLRFDFSRDVTSLEPAVTYAAESYFR